MESTNNNYWVLPTMAFKLIDDLVQKAGATDQDIKSKREYNKTREAWIAAVYLLRRILIEGEVWYLRKNDVIDSATDIFARKMIIKRNEVIAGEELSVQVFRYLNKPTMTLIDAIKKKLRGDLKNVSLVCYVMVDAVIDWQDITGLLQTIKPLLNDITIIGNIDERRLIVGEVYPKHLVSIVNLDLLRINAPAIIEPTPVVDPKDVGITHLGKALLEANFNIKKYEE